MQPASAGAPRACAGTRADMNRNQTGFNLGYVIIAVMGVLVLQDFWMRRQAVATIPYSEFQKLVREDKIANVVVGQDQLSGEFKEAIGGKKRFIAVRVDADIAKELDQHGVEYRDQFESNFVSLLLSWMVPIAIFGGLWIFLGRRMAKQLGGPGGLMAIGKSKAKVYVETDTKVTFADVAGGDEAKTELQEVVAFLKDPKQHGRLGARMPKGVLLVGPPGTGKTLLARAVAGEAAVPFYSISGSEFVEMFVGVGASRVRDLFDQAKRNAPCIVFVDEIDAVGRQRGAGLGGSHDEREQTLNQILVEMDGFDSNTNVIVIAATNRPDVLDPALLRPGRFDRQVVLPAPDINGRKAILEVHSKGKPFDKTVDLNVIGKVTPGFSGADLANLINEGAILAARRNKKTIGMSELEEAIDRVIAGPERKSRVMSDREKELTAYHESGHAIAMRYLEHHDPVHKVTIISRGMMGGYTRPLPPEDRYYMTKSQFKASIASALGGHAAEQVVFGEISTGAENDIEKATNIAHKMVKEYGMSERLGTVALGHKEELVFLGREIGEQKKYSEKTAEAIDEAIRRLIC